MEIPISKITKIINRIKEFWKITNFKKEIQEWNFPVNLNGVSSVVIGHPMNSHKGTSVGDILPYTRLPELLKMKYPEIKVFVPQWFYPFFKDNPYIDGINNNVERWGSLGTWGTTVQRTNNVWGCTSTIFTPKIYQTSLTPEKTPTIVVCINSKTGGKIKNLKYVESILKKLTKDYDLIQLAVLNEYHLPYVKEYIFNASYQTLIDTLNRASFYLGVQNSIYHLAKALGVKIIGLLPENIDSFFVNLPLLTQVNHLELEMLTPMEQRRSQLWRKWCLETNRNPDDSHHVGWLYPDVTHLTLNVSHASFLCPPLTVEHLDLAMRDKLYPYNDSRFWDITNPIWTEGE